MKTIAFMIIYLGQLPDFFLPWLNSCGLNPTIDFLVFTDDKRKFEAPSNVKFLPVTKEGIRERIQSIFDFPINLDKPYKLCDFRPAYGEIFAKELEGYDFWGHCDIDQLMGNLRHFLTDEILDTYDRIGSCGPCTLYKNSPVVNAYYRTLTAPNCSDYREVFSDSDFWGFDEDTSHRSGGMSVILPANNVPIYDYPVEAATLNALWSGGKLVVGEHKKVCAHRTKEGLFLEKEGKTLYELPYLHIHNRLKKIHMDAVLGEDFYFLAPFYYQVDARANAIGRKVESLVMDMKMAGFQLHNKLGAWKAALLKK